MSMTQLTLRDILIKSTGYLSQKRVDSPRLSAELVIAHALGVDRLALFLDPDKPLGENELARIRPFLIRRGTGEPMAYILGHKEFYGLDFLVSKDVLIPRPDTELGVDLVLKSFPKERKLLFADVGSGSGALAVTLLTKFPNGQAIATDISLRTLGISKLNAQRHGVSERILTVQGDLLKHLGSLCLDFIIANLPYISEDEARTLSPEVICYEPRQALIGGPKGDELFAPLLSDAMRVLKRGGCILLETGSTQAAAVHDHIQRISANWKRVRVHKDLSGLDRFVSAWWE
ncbi:release factor glutamine methyltransferase [Desulfonatronum thiosulfatophilum]|uniref:Release factor glutamine methyltransferase n=1 Tax=Desulfonatronum thiosulfatophilum TaxID=617002 RepID=A0A1G6AUL6_9BACT|nr:peptide chain release factor N(5)-glutamine methyltransferase [Desulfonatronum thiosulfatophilum]SDB12086.1 release factor glutamine methyltransferase [Desulfonatronum thiosulfatophilum]